MFINLFVSLTRCSNKFAVPLVGAMSLYILCIVHVGTWAGRQRNLVLRHTTRARTASSSCF